MTPLERLNEAPAEIRQLAGEWPLCLFFRLKPGSNVVVAGAYKGAVMELLLRLYPEIRVYGFEPQPWAYEQARDRVTGRAGWFTTAQVHPFALGIESGRAEMGEWGTDACSLVNTGTDAREHGHADVREIGAVWDALGLTTVDLFVMNMEGYEFQLLDHMMKGNWNNGVHDGLMSRVKRLAVQWHLGLHGTEEQTRIEMNDLIPWLHSQGLELVYDERPTWTYHERKSDEAIVRP